MQTVGGGKRRGLNWLLAATTALALTQALPAAAQRNGGDLATTPIAQATQSYTFDIPSQPLPQAIADLSAVTGLQVLYSCCTLAPARKKRPHSFHPAPGSFRTAPPPPCPT
jgi:hypothetical protein